jgi:hypothetical protein
MPMRFPPPNWQRLLVLLGLLALIPLLPPSTPAHADSAGAPYMAPISQGSDADFFGIVGRDPDYEWNTDPAQYPNDVNRAALEGMARDLAYAGAGWVRIELRAEHDVNAPGGPGYIDYRKWDWFIKECAPKYGLKVLLLLGSGLLDHSTVDPSVAFARINDPPDRLDDTNNYVRLYAARAREVADHFGDSVAAYEILNEPNISDILYQDTNGEQVEFKPEIFGALLAEVYTAIKPAHPGVQLIVGGLLYGARPNGGSADLDYLWKLYHSSPRLEEYKAANGHYPFDGVAIHAYFVGTPQEIVDHLWALRGVMVDAEDTSKLWLTEIGVSGTPPTVDPSYLAATPTASEDTQAAFIKQLFAMLQTQTQGFVAHAFWFKYEDFPLGSQWVDYGLVRLPIVGQSYVQPPSPRKMAFEAFQSVANPSALPGTPEDPGTLPADAYYFPQTEHAISGAFRQYWEQNGGLMRFGYPLTKVFLAGGTRVQYFERARFEYHPENTPPYDVELGLLTGYLTQDRSFPKAPAITPTPTPAPPPPCPTTPTVTPTTTTIPLATATPTATTPARTPAATCVPVTPTTAATVVAGPITPTATPEPTTIYFPQTGHNLGGAFLQYWKTTGGLASYGYPISEELREINQADGKTYVVQYFERARFELHPENQPPYNVLLGQMGRETLNGGGWYR